MQKAKGIVRGGIVYGLRLLAIALAATAPAQAGSTFQIYPDAVASCAANACFGDSSEVSPTGGNSGADLRPRSNPTGAVKNMLLVLAVPNEAANLLDRDPISSVTYYPNAVTRTSGALGSAHNHAPLSTISNEGLPAVGEGPATGGHFQQSVATAAIYAMLGVAQVKIPNPVAKPNTWDGQVNLLTATHSDRAFLSFQLPMNVISDGNDLIDALLNDCAVPVGGHAYDH